MVSHERRQLARAPASRAAMMCSIGSERTQDLRRDDRASRPAKRNWSKPKAKAIPINIQKLRTARPSLAKAA
jgi:hypothetical protein